MPREFDDPYLYPGTTVLRNIPGIRNEATLRAFEYEHTKLRLEELREKPIPGKFDLDHLKAIHAYVFQDVYAWAGQIRAVNISKGGSHFAQAQFIESAARGVQRQLDQDGQFKNLEKPVFVEKLAAHYADWNVLHPFREGNGRATRELIGQLARAAGYDVDQVRIDNDKGQWNEAARRSLHGDLQPVQQIFTEAVRPSRAIAFERLSEQQAVARHPELRQAFDNMRAIEHQALARLSDPAKVSSYMDGVRQALLERLDRSPRLDRPMEPSLEAVRPRATEPERQR
jgi:cell filamentation protein